MRIVNKRGLHEYSIEDRLEAGIVLLGREVKSIREGRLDLSQSFARIVGDEAFLVNANIPNFSGAPVTDYNPTRTRKLLLHRSQIRKLIGQLSQSKITLIPVAIYDKNNFIKVEIGLGKAKKQYDKRRQIKERDQKRREEQEFRGKE